MSYAQLSQHKLLKSDFIIDKIKMHSKFYAYNATRSEKKNTQRNKMFYKSSM